MEKRLPKIGRHVAGLKLGERPPELALQIDALTKTDIPAPTIVPRDDTDTNEPEESPISRTVAGPHPVSYSPVTKAMQKVKLTCATVNLVLELPVYAVDVQDECINLQVMQEFALKGERLEFKMEVGPNSYEVIFLGLTAKFPPNFHMLMFVRKPAA